MRALPLLLLLAACEKKAAPPTEPIANGDPLAGGAAPAKSKEPAPLPDQAELDGLAGDAGLPTVGNENARTAILAKSRGAFKKCWLTAVEKDKEKTTTSFSLKVVVDDAGKVPSVAVLDLVGSKTMAECCAGAVKGLTLAPNSASTVTIALKFNAQ